MGQTSLSSHARTRTTIFLSHVGGFLLVILAAYWLRSLTIPRDALLQGYLEVISSLSRPVPSSALHNCMQYAIYGY